MSGRSTAILARFPAHLEATRPGKALGEAVAALAADLDLLSARLAAVRRAHRLGDADERTDLLRIGALHGIAAGELEVLMLRVRHARAMLAALAAAPAPGRDAAARALMADWSIGDAAQGLALFAPPPANPGDPPDLEAAWQALQAAGADALRYARVADAVRTRVAAIARQHAEGNGTVKALLVGAANALDLEIGPIAHSADRFWHAAVAADRLRLGGQAPAEELIGIEENPIWRDSTDRVERVHGKPFTLIRRGFERALLQVRITGLAGGRTVGPMLVNRDEGHGVGFVGTVPHGKELVFTEEGRVLLDGADVSSMAYAWQGGCFAGSDLDPALDFVFDGPGRDAARRPATFVTTTPPPAALDREAAYPGAGVPLPMPGIAVGTTRLVFFVQEAHAASLDPPARSVTPRTRAAVFDHSVLAPGPAEVRGPAAEVALSWLEHRAFAVRLLIPPRFRALADAAADPDGIEVLRRTAQAAQRFRPVGVELTVEYIDDRWVLGSGALSEGDASDPIARLRSATSLWAGPDQNQEPSP